MRWSIFISTWWFPSNEWINTFSITSVGCWKGTSASSLRVRVGPLVQEESWQGPYRWSSFTFSDNIRRLCTLSDKDSNYEGWGASTRCNYEISHTHIFLQTFKQNLPMRSEIFWKMNSGQSASSLSPQWWLMNSLLTSAVMIQPVLKNALRQHQKWTLIFCQSRAGPTRKGPSEELWFTKACWSVCSTAWVLSASCSQ